LAIYTVIFPLENPMGLNKDCRTYSAWGSLICGLFAVIATTVFLAYPKPANDPSPISLPESIWMMATFPISLVGLILGTLKRNFPGIAGLVICGCALLLLLLASIAV
jgi:hypothetical protein